MANHIHFLVPGSEASAYTYEVPGLSQWEGATAYPNGAEPGECCVSYTVLNQGSQQISWPVRLTRDLEYVHHGQISYKLDLVGVRNEVGAEIEGNAPSSQGFSRRDSVIRR